MRYVFSSAKNLYTDIDSNNPDSGQSININGSSVNLDNVCRILSDTNTSISTYDYAMTLLNHLNTYNTYISGYQASEVDTTATSGCGDWVTNAQEQGWIMAASYYNDLGALNSSCSSSNTATPWTAFMPYAVNSNVATDKTKYPCMTTASGYNASDVCVDGNLDKTVMSNWAVVNSDDTSINGNNDKNADANGGVFQTYLGNTTSNGVTTYTGIQYLIDLMMPDVSSGVIEQGTFDSYFNDMLASYLKILL